ncbi:hydrolase 1, exosortase A system-associated [Uliginosibacterium sp. sgz301328]|uniref:hydrolase 1, exosortase A system-associated n=1 Tax=Uliginosibacterium sp. sgz301328 TaxID=3243764 RepID=UPI00359D0D26
MRRSVTYFACAGASLPAIIEGLDAACETGVLIVVGGPQYRVGSHRQFVLLARALASAGIPCMRFDYRGMGDADGAAQDFEESGADIDAAIGAFQSVMPTVRKVVLWGLCDGATAAIFAAADDPRVTAVVMANPWIRTEQGQSDALVHGYYGRRLLSVAMWKKLLRGELAVGKSVRELIGHWRTARTATASNAPEQGSLWQRARPLPERMAQALRTYRGQVLIVLSGNDLVADEFRLAAARAPLAGVLQSASIRWHEVPQATHTFSSAAWRDNVAAATIAFVGAL